VRIVTLNTWKNEGEYARRLPLMREWLAAMTPDVICLQECFCAEGFDTAFWLAAELGLELHAAPARGKPRPHSGGNLFSTSGLAVLVRGEAASTRLALTSHPADGERIAQRLDLVAQGESLRILNLHLTHLRGAAELRAIQLREALAWAGADLAGGLVVAGDLNASAADPAIAPLGLEPRPPTTQAARIDLEAPRAIMAIDHCVLLRRGHWREIGLLRGCDAPDPDGWLPSDHAAVGMELALSPAGPTLQHTT
jgi:endonuclease/exonuclease/phosphatase family metal-dependent hydrolase